MYAVQGVLYQERLSPHATTLYSLAPQPEAQMELQPEAQIEDRKSTDKHKSRKWMPLPESIMPLRVWVYEYQHDKRRIRRALHSFSCTLVDEISHLDCTPVSHLDCTPVSHLDCTPVSHLDCTPVSHLDCTPASPFPSHLCGQEELSKQRQLMHQMSHDLQQLRTEAPALTEDMVTNRDTDIN